MGLVQDALALAMAGLAELSSALTLVDLWKNEKECKPFFYSAYDPISLTVFIRSCLV